MVRRRAFEHPADERPHAGEEDPAPRLLGERPERGIDLEVPAGDPQRMLGAVPQDLIDQPVGEVALDEPRPVAIAIALR